MVRVRTSLPYDVVKHTFLFLMYFWILENRFSELVEIVVISMIVLMTIK